MANKQKLTKFKSLSTTPQTSTSLGLVGLYSQIASTLQTVEIGNLLQYINTLSYGEFLNFIAPIIVFIWAIIFDEKSIK